MRKTGTTQERKYTMNFDFVESGMPFKGNVKDPDKAAKLEILKKAAGDLSASSFVSSYTIMEGPENRNAQIKLSFPDVITFNGERKDKLPAILNLADNYTIIKTNNGFCITVTVLDLWKE